jgi:transmembrane sensor
VRAGNGTVTALGTVFNIRHSRQGAEVTVTEHSVAVKLDGYTENQPTETIVAQGQQVAYDPENGLSAVKTVDTRIATAWQRGKLVVQDKPLGEVIAELNHYHRGYFVIADPNIAQHRINGVFNTDNPIGALNAIEKFQHLRSNRLSHYLVLLHR